MDAGTLKRVINDLIMPYLKDIEIHPNIITLIAFLIMLLAGFLVFTGNIVWAGIFIVASGILDILDGAVAKAREQTSQFGALLDRVSDRACDFVAMASLIATGYVNLMLGMYVLLVVPLASYISACMEAATNSRIGERLSMRAFRIIILSLACFSDSVSQGMLLLAVVGTYSTVSRLFAAYRLLDRDLRHTSTASLK